MEWMMDDITDILFIDHAIAFYILVSVTDKGTIAVCHLSLTLASISVLWSFVLTLVKEKFIKSVMSLTLSQINKC